MSKTDKAQQYADALQRIQSTLADECNPITVMAIVVSILKESFLHFYWVGFLFVDDREMVLGPFQGPPACVRLPLDSPGVCGTCYRTGRPVMVPDVAAFQGRVGCDSISKAEIALPIFLQDKVVAILDIDSTELGSVDEVDKAALEQVSRFISSRLVSINWPREHRF